MQTAARPRGVLGGAILIAVGTVYLLLAVGFAHAGSALFVALGLAFAAAYALGTRQYVYLVPAAVLLGFGLGLFVPSVLGLPVDVGAPLFLALLAAGLAAVFVLAPDRRWPLIPAALVALIALAVAFGVQLPRDTLSYAIPLILIAVGAYLLVEQRGH